MKKVITRNERNFDTVQHYVDLFIDECVVRLTTQTVSNYTISLKKFNETVTIESLEDINNNIINKFIISCKEENLAIATINHYLRDIRTFVNWLYNNEYIPKKVSVKLLKGQEEKSKVYTEDELKQLLKPPVASDSYPMHRSYNVICFILATGARSATVRNIQMSDIDFDHREIYYRHTKNKHFQVIPTIATA